MARLDTPLKSRQAEGDRSKRPLSRVVRGPLGRGLGRLSWRLGLAMIGLVLFTAISIGFLVAYSFTAEIDTFYNSLNPELQQVFDRQLDRAFESSGSPASLDNQPALILPILLPALLALILAVWMSRRIARPLEAVSQAASEVAAGQLEARVQLTARQLRAGDEASGLARNFNGMAESLEALERERRESSAAIAHELRTPLTVLRARLQAGVDGVLPLDEAAARILLQQTELLSRLVDDLKTLSLADADQLHLNLAPLELCAFVQEQVEGFQGRAAQRDLRLECHCEERTLFIQADRQRMAQVLFNLLENAIRYTPDGGAVTVRLERHSVAGVSRIRLTVEDSGPGIPPEALEHVFERFWRTDVSRSRHSGGSGLGLAIVRSIVTLHGGQVWAENRLEGGAKLVMQL